MYIVCKQRNQEAEELACEVQLLVWAIRCVTARLLLLPHYNFGDAVGYAA